MAYQGTIKVNDEIINEQNGWSLLIAKGFNLTQKRLVKREELENAYAVFFSENEDYDYRLVGMLLSFIWKNRYVDLYISYDCGKLSVNGKNIFGDKIEWAHAVNEEFAALFLPEIKLQYTDSLTIEKKNIYLAKEFANWLYKYGKKIKESQYREFAQNLDNEIIRQIKEGTFESLTIYGSYE